MRLLYLDFNEVGFEDYSLDKCNRYGGGKCVASNLLPYMVSNGHYMEIWGGRGNFDNLSKHLRLFCTETEWDLRRRIGQGEPLKNFLGDKQFDIVLHHNGGMWVNCEGLKTVPLYWAVGVHETINEGNQNIILYNDYQYPRIQHPNPNIFKARIGVPIPEFQQRLKEPFIFTCCRHPEYFGTGMLADICVRNRIKCFLAGPLDPNFDLKKHIDNKYVEYLGVIDEETKIEFQKFALCSAYLHFWDVPFNLSSVLSLAYGSPIITTHAGFFPSLVNHGVNGFMINNELDFVAAFNKCHELNQKDCWDTANKFSADKMVQDYMNVFEKVLAANP